ncbi:MAG: transposase [Candidatus Omnitrophica bacterium]|nr:transposase [Candidatus Omnitrophota bacterium]
MARLPRIYIANSLYYITAKGNLGENIFVDEEDYKMYLELLKKYKEQYGFRLYSFALMPASLSLLMELKEGETISMVMHDINSSYTKYFNSRYSKKGHVFSERFKSAVAEKETYLLSLINYVHTAPARLGLVKDPQDYTYASTLQYLYFRDTSKRNELNTNVQNLIVDIRAEIKEALDFMSRLFPQARDYADFLAGAAKEEMDGLTKKIVSAGLLGTDEFIASVEKAMEKRKEAEKQEKKYLMHPAVYFSFAVLVAGVVVANIYYQKVNKAEAPIIIEKEPETAHLEALDGTEWILEMKPEAQVKLAYPQFDKITFKDGAISSIYLVSQGFATSNYSLHRSESGTLVWETMQTNEAGETIFLRGEEKDGTMNGSFRRNFKDGISDGVNFSSPGYYKLQR